MEDFTLTEYIYKNGPIFFLMASDEENFKVTGTVLQGGTDQILMPRDWPLEWKNDIRVVPSK